MWEDHVRFADGAQDGLLRLLTGPEAPDYIIRLQPLDQCDESRQLAAAIARSYVSEGKIGTAEVLRRNDLAAPAG